MAGYTRQSGGSIVNTLDITAAPLNNEFNAVQGAFDAASGHSHDGTTGNAPKINLATSVTGYLPATNGGTGGKNNITTTSDPTANDDSADGYVVGSMWVNTNTGRVFICAGNATGAAVWQSLTHYNSTGSAVAPDADGTIALGTANKRWSNLFTSGTASVGTNLTVGGTGVFTSSVSASSYNTTSDYRAKTVTGYMNNVTDDLMSLSPMKGIREDEDQERAMFIAHEVQRVAPYAVTGKKDAVDADGTPVYQTVDYSALVPMLWASLQEAVQRIEDLELLLEDKE